MKQYIQLKINMCMIISEPQSNILHDRDGPDHFLFFFMATRAQTWMSEFGLKLCLASGFMNDRQIIIPNLGLLFSMYLMNVFFMRYGMMNFRGSHLYVSNQDIYWYSLIQSHKLLDFSHMHTYV